MDIPWTTIKPSTLHESQDFELRYRPWPALDVVDRAETLTLEFGEEIFDLVAGFLTLRSLNETSKNAQMQLMINSARELLMTKATGKTGRRFMVDYFAAAKVERNDGETWVRLVVFDETGGGEEPSIPDLSGLGTMNIGITTGLLWHLAEVHFGPLFSGRLSKAAEKAETSSESSSTLGATG